jgi:hypothetical protein
LCVAEIVELIAGLEPRLVWDRRLALKQSQTTAKGSLVWRMVFGFVPYWNDDERNMVFIENSNRSLQEDIESDVKSLAYLPARND